MDSYQGSIYEPVTLHKYLYANANPVMYTDPSGYMGVLLATTEGACLSVSDAQNNAIIFAIGRQLLLKAWALKAIQTVSIITTEVLIALVVKDALNEGHFTDAYDVAVEILQNALDNIEVICNEAGIASDLQ